MTKKRIITLAVTSLVAVGLLAGCGAPAKKAPKAGSTTETKIEQKAQVKKDANKSKDTKATKKKDATTKKATTSKTAQDAKKKAAAKPEAKKATYAALAKFDAKTLDGKSVTQDVLKKNDITMLTFWKTDDKNAVDAMKNLEAMQKKLPKNVQSAVVFLDGATKEKEAKQLVSDAKYSGIAIKSGDGDFKAMADKVKTGSTTLLIDGSGKVVGETTFKDAKNIEKDYIKVLNDALKTMGKPQIKQ